MFRHEGPHLDLTIALHRLLYLAIIMDSHKVEHTALLNRFRLIPALNLLEVG
jgi:hypothetical protein